MLERSKIGLASSVAKPLNYSWESTAQYARTLHLKQLQLFLNTAQLNHANRKLLLHLEEEFVLHLHLPAGFLDHVCSSFVQALFQQIKHPFYLVQHQQFVDETLLNWSAEMSSKGVVLAVENDLAEQSPSEFLSYIKAKQRQHPTLIPVLDVPRFFHQKPNNLNFFEVEQEVLTVVETLILQNQPFIFHAIDHSKQGSTRPFWRPLLSGDLPWPKLLQKVSKQAQQLKCLMLEYENWDMAQQAIRNLEKARLLKPKEDGVR